MPPLVVSSEDAGVSSSTGQCFEEFSQQMYNPRREILDKEPQGIRSWILEGSRGHRGGMTATVGPSRGG